MKFNWYLHSYENDEIEDGLYDKVGNHPDIKKIVKQIKKFKKMNFEWNEKTKKLKLVSVN